MATFKDQIIALQMREIIRGIIREELDKLRPKYQLATVTGIDRAHSKCQVRFNGETTSSTIPMGSIQPKEVGQIVRVDGMAGDRFIAEVLGPAFQPLEARVAALEAGP